MGIKSNVNTVKWQEQWNCKVFGKEITGAKAVRPS